MFEWKQILGIGVPALVMGLGRGQLFYSCRVGAAAIMSLCHGTKSTQPHYAVSRELAAVPNR